MYFCEFFFLYVHWLVVWNAFYFSIHWELIIIPTDFHIFQRGWNHQPVQMRQLMCTSHSSSREVKLGKHGWRFNPNVEHAMRDTSICRAALFSWMAFIKNGNWRYWIRLLSLNFNHGHLPTISPSNIWVCNGVEKIPWHPMSCFFPLFPLAKNHLSTDAATARCRRVRCGRPSASSTRTVRQIRLCSRRSLVQWETFYSMGISGSKMEVPTIYKAYFSGLIFRGHRPKIWPYIIWY